MFTNKSYPNFFRVVPSETAFNAPRLALLRAFNWTRVGTLYQNEPRYSLAHNRLVADLEDAGISIEESQSFVPRELETALSRLRRRDVRVILGNFNETWARRVFCAAKAKGLVGRRYQWLLVGTYSRRWWEVVEKRPPKILRSEDDEMEPEEEEENDFSHCSPDELSDALEGCILTDLLPLSTNGEITVSGITASEYREEYDLRRGGEYSRFHGYTYDGVWAIALAIQHVSRRLLHRTNPVEVKGGPGQPPRRLRSVAADFRYRDETWEKLFLEALKNTSFEGVTGPVRFYENERKAGILLKQFQGGHEVKIGEYDGATGRLELGPQPDQRDSRLDISEGGVPPTDWEDMGVDVVHPVRWKSGGPPKDRTLTLTEQGRVHLPIFACLATASTLGILMAVCFLVINIKYRHQRYIKMSSPHLNNLIIIGCILTYLSVIFLGLDSRLTSESAFPIICTSRAWLLMAGFSLAFGSMFSKTWRVHSIFTDVKLNKKVIKDYQLFMVVGVLLVIDLAIMTTWQITAPFYRETKQMEPYPHPSSEDIVIIPENEYCQSGNMTVFVGSIYAYKGLLLIFGAFLAWETRYVSIPALNDSRLVGLSVYNCVIFCIAGAAVSFVLSDHQDASFLIVSIFILFCTTGTLCLVFVPKLIELKRNPQGSMEKRIRATLRPMSKRRRDSDEPSDAGERLREVSEENARKRRLIRERDAEIQSLVSKLGGPDAAKDIIDSDMGGMDRLAVPRNDSVLKREAPSGTETTDISSLCSINSSVDGEYVNLSVDTPNQRKKTTFAKLPTISASKETVVLSAAEQKPGEGDSGHVMDTTPEETEEDSRREGDDYLPDSDVSHHLSSCALHPTPPHQQHPSKMVSFSDSTPPPASSHPTPSNRFPTHQGSSGRRSSAAPTLVSDAIHQQSRTKPTSSTTRHQRRTSVPFTIIPTQVPPPIPDPMNVDPMPTDFTPPVPAEFANPVLPEDEERELEEANHHHQMEAVKAFRHQQQSHFPAIESHRMYPIDTGFSHPPPPPSFSNPSILDDPYIKDTEVYVSMSGGRRGSGRRDMLDGRQGICVGSRRDSGHASEEGLDSSGGGYGGKELGASSPNVSRAIHEGEEDVTMIQRSVSERSRERAAGSLRGQGSTIPLGHVQSTPDVARLCHRHQGKCCHHGAGVTSGTHHHHHQNHNNNRGMNNNGSSDADLDLAILPIFQKLLSERHKSRRGGSGGGTSYSIASCPNISIKCDIVEYL
ncbi:gamma-aminobutyric acid type B receptor subunit 2-like [Ischnura elegans]|uniref:gamma-aminobutyric acid type B receptor subunit 2-like n=1 Tax=Ischnura elegans TaxID=197161 RepID=UPI001ED8AA27|nr:gamma-aminobutyric acid type B receptor subunit 2-like [Ischnura elegans]